MSDAVLVALIVGLLSGAFTIVATLITGSQRRSEKREDWVRQDEVAAKAAEAAALLLTANERVAATAVVTNNKLDVIHTLVNSNMSAALQAELDATIRELAMMREVAAIKEASGDKPSVETLAAIEATASKVEELSTTVRDRKEATHRAELQSG